MLRRSPAPPTHPLPASRPSPHPLASHPAVTRPAPRRLSPALPASPPSLPAPSPPASPQLLRATPPPALLPMAMGTRRPQASPAAPEPAARPAPRASPSTWFVPSKLGSCPSILASIANISLRNRVPLRTPAPASWLLVLPWRLSSSSKSGLARYDFGRGTKRRVWMYTSNSDVMGFNHGSMES